MGTKELLLQGQKKHTKRSEWKATRQATGCCRLNIDMSRAIKLTDLNGLGLDSWTFQVLGKGQQSFLMLCPIC